MRENISGYPVEKVTRDKPVSDRMWGKIEKWNFSIARFVSARTWHKLGMRKKRAQKWEEKMNFSGILTAGISFLVIGIFHPIVIRAEYYYTKRCWPVFLVAGLACLGLSAFAKQEMPSVLLGVLGCTFLWSIQELYEQEERVRKGWFPENPNRQK